MNTHRLTVADLNRHIARKMAANLAAAEPAAFKPQPSAHTAPLPPKHTSTPRIPRHAPGGPLTMVEPEGDPTMFTDPGLLEAMEGIETAAYTDGFTWGAICGAAASLMTIIAAVLVYAWSQP